MSNPIYSMYNEGANVEIIRAALKATAERAKVTAARGQPDYRNIDGVAVVPIVGAMLRGIGAEVAEWFGLTDTNIARAAVENAAADPRIDSIMLRVNSPGGSVDGLFELGETITKARAQKPVVAFVDGMAASAAYYAASAASAIYAGKMDLVGSIGTRMTVWDASKAFEQMGIKVHAVTTGEHKAAGEYGTEVTESQIAEFRRMVDGYFADFRRQVMTGRRMTAEQFATVADGRMLFSDEATAAGLIDGVATFQDVLKQMKNASDAKRRLASF